MSQIEKPYNLLRSRYPIRTDDILKFVYGSEHLGCARISARIKDVKSRYKVEIIGWHEENNSSLYWYQLVNNEILLEEIPEYSAYNGGQGKLI